MQMKKDKDTDKYISMLLYGQAGSGKSILANTFPKAVIFDFDNSHKRYKKHFADNTYVQGSEAFKLLQIAIGQVIEGKNKFQTIVIDSLTNAENQAISIKKGINSQNWATSLYNSKGRKLNYDDWGDVSSSTVALFTELRSYPVNVVIITQVENVHDNGKMIAKPMLVGKGQDESLHFPDFVGYMSKQEGKDGVERYLHLSSHMNDSFVAKARLIQGDVEPIKNPSYEKIMKLIDNDKFNLNFND